MSSSPALRVSPFSSDRSGQLKGTQVVLASHKEGFVLGITQRLGIYTSNAMETQHEAFVMPCKQLLTLRGGQQGQWEGQERGGGVLETVNPVLWLLVAESSEYRE